MPRKPVESNPEESRLDFTGLVEAIRLTHEHCAAHVGRVVNISLTLRNWATGCYIREYEQNGADRAEYGTQLLERLSEALGNTLDRCYTGRYLGLCRQFFDVYPSIRKSVISEFGDDKPPAKQKKPRPESKDPESLLSHLGLDGHTLVNRLSFTHIVLLTPGFLIF